MEIADPEVRILAGIASTPEADHASADTEWQGSPFAWIETKPSRQRVRIGEQLVAGRVAARGFNVTRSPDSRADRVIEDRRVEIKFSTLWKNGNYKFQQLRDQNCDLAICLGVCPFDAHCWVLSKDEILTQWHETGNIRSQHGGARGTDTAWFTVDPSEVAPWLRGFGGGLRDALGTLSGLTGFTAGDPQE